MRLPLLPFTLISILLLTACPVMDDDDSVDDDDDGVGDRCDLGETGPDTAFSPVVTDTSELETWSTQQQNTVGIDSTAAYGPHPRGGARIGPCGEVGLAAVLRENAPNRLVYHNLTTGSVDDLGAASWASPGLVFDDDCSPLVLLGDGTSVVEQRRVGPDWSSRTAFDVALMGLSGSVDLVSVDPGGDGLLHVLAHVWEGDDIRLLHASRSSAAGVDWTTELLDSPPAVTVWDYAVDGLGRIHAVYERGDFPCDPCDVALRYASLEGGGGWQETVVEEGLWGPPHDEMAVDASLAVDSQDRPVIAASFRRRAVTGSMQSQALRVYAERDGELCAEQPVAENDGFTGALPALVVDDDDRIHVLFADLAAWHGSNGWSNTITGQLRYSVRSGSSWTTATLLQQSGPDTTPQPLVGVTAPSLAVAGDGSQAVIGATTWSWQTDSIYNDTEVPLDLDSSARLIDTISR
jgi:hypothetical protein